MFIETRWGLGYRYIGPYGESSAPSQILYPSPVPKIAESF